MLNNILSLCDGYSCGQIALKELGVPYGNYFASEIKRAALRVTAANFPKTIFLGDLKNWRSWNLPKIDLLIFGSPCQDFSCINTTRAEDKKGLNGDKSSLFFVCLEILKHLQNLNPDLLFMCENVLGSEILGKYLGVEPRYSSALAFNCCCERRRLFFTNIGKNHIQMDLFGGKTIVPDWYFPTKNMNKGFIPDENPNPNLYNLNLPYLERFGKIGSPSGPSILAAGGQRHCLLRNRNGRFKNRFLFMDSTGKIRDFSIDEMKQFLCVPPYINFLDYSEYTAQDLIGDGWNIEQVKFIFSKL